MFGQGRKELQMIYLAKGLTPIPPIDLPFLQKLATNQLQNKTNRTQLGRWVV
jgi:hypothetical protein